MRRGRARRRGTCFCALRGCERERAWSAAASAAWPCWRRACAHGSPAARRAAAAAGCTSARPTTRRCAPRRAGLRGKCDAVRGGMLAGAGPPARVGGAGADGGRGGVHAGPPRCVRECAWAGETPNPASCSRACGPFEPHCVHACVAAREAAAEGERPEAAAAAAAAASAETAAPVRASAAPPPTGGDAAVCARAWSRGRARRRARGRRRPPRPASVPFTRR
jgi:hypothetical protein